AQGRRELKRALIDRMRLARECVPLAMMAGTVIALMCLVGPVVALWHGIERALLVTMPSVYMIGIIAIVMLLSNRRAYGLARTDIAHMAIEFLFCPFLVGNVVKKIVVRQGCAGNTLSLIEHFERDPAEAKRKVLAHLEETR